MPNPIVDITDVFSAAESVPIETVKVGDRVFSVTGETSPVTRVRVGKRTATVHSGFLPLQLPLGETMTVTRQHPNLS